MGGQQHTFSSSDENDSDEDNSIVCSELDKGYLNQSYWEKTPVKNLKQLPYDSGSVQHV